MWVAVFVAAVLLGASQPLARIVTDAQWFSAVGHYTVFQTRLFTELALGIGGAIVAMIIVGGSAQLAVRHARDAPPSPLASPEAGPIGVVLANTPPRVLATVLSLFVAVIAGMRASAWWREALLMWNGEPFGHSDPVWGLDASFYIFDLPMILHAQGWLAFLLGAAGVVAMGLYVARGVVRLQMVQQDGQLMANGIVMPAEVRRHLASLCAALLALWAIGTYLRRYELMYTDTGLITGPGYSDLYGTLPLLTVQAVLTAIAAFIAFVGIDRGSIATGMLAGVLVVASSAATGLYPSLLQQFSVNPNELSREGAQIVDHVKATRAAFDLADIAELPLSGKDGLSRADIDDNEPTIENIRLWDHAPLLSTFSQVQEIRTYYGFSGVDNDRYVVDGKLRQIMLSPRELTVDELPPQARTWVNETMTYTHGYGVALGPVNRISDQGLPELWIQDLPPKVEYADAFPIERPEVYFGEATRTEVLVNTANPEFDYPVGDKNEYTTYAGKAGVTLDALNRLMFSIRLGWTNLLFSSDVTSESKILIHRNVRERARQVAPFVLFDRDPYMVIDDGRLVWVLDGYTTSDRFPYAQHFGRIGNYMRNSVKVTVDAYDGTVTVWWSDEDDPIAKAWSKIFPGLLRPMEQMSENMRAHLRFPIDQFEVQARLFATYHMQDHQIFYNREDEWEVPVVEREPMRPYYTIMRLPGEDKEEFILMLPFSPKGKPNLAAWMVARADGEHLGELRVYKFPKDTMVYGPKMVVARINQNDEISEKISLWDQQGSSVDLGTLLVIPIEESLIYVQPLYLKAAEDSIPELKRVIVAYEDRIAMTPTLEEGLAQLFGGQADVAVATAAEPSAPDTEGGPPPAARVIDDDLASQIEEAARLYEAANAASRAGDWTRFGNELDALGKALETLKTAQQAEAAEQ
ncbi:MAG: UPF0182 family protein [Myxococcales bacterium]|nr:UPF0182 family protein [Myxococcales bacterium]